MKTCCLGFLPNGQVLRFFLLYEKRGKRGRRGKKRRKKGGMKEGREKGRKKFMLSY